MQPPPSPRLVAQGWLERAERGLAVARLTRGAVPPLLEMSADHAQQAAEKALKGFLVRHGQAAPRVHDLVPLLAACCSGRPGTVPWRAVPGSCRTACALVCLRGLRGATR